MLLGLPLLCLEKKICNNFFIFSYIFFYNIFFVIFFFLNNFEQVKKLVVIGSYFADFGQVKSLVVILLTSKA